ncbi:MAG: hypothetical protein ACR2IV_00150 [Bryobacteraceae bacterium]
MNTKLVENIADAVLYEGYMLYPYRASAIKNQQRWNFGVLYPRAFAESQRGSDSWSMQTECLAQSFGGSARLTLRLRFLHLLERSAEDQPAQTWQEGTECDVNIASLNIAALSSHSERHEFAFAARTEKDGTVSRKWESIEGCLESEADELGNGLFKIRLRVFNTASIDDATRSSRDRVLLRSLLSAHTILKIEDGEFISLLEPPEELREAAAQCKNAGTWPVLVGDHRERDAILSSPIILYDYPQIAPESAGNLFDGTEIDEILTLRIMTMTDDEKAEMGQVDERTRQILERTESMPPEQLMKMHGVLRGLRELRQETP